MGPDADAFPCYFPLKGPDVDPFFCCFPLTSLDADAFPCCFPFKGLDVDLIKLISFRNLPKLAEYFLMSRNNSRGFSQKNADFFSFLSALICVHPRLFFLVAVCPRFFLEKKSVTIDINPIFI
jgi:hypothetical protein